MVFVNSLTVFASSILLEKGMENDAVKYLQDDLSALGYFYVDSTGYYGDITENAVKRLQSDYGLLKDGIAGESTYSLINSLLRSDKLLKKGMRGPEVKALQNDLKTLGVFYVDSTGYYGSITEKSVKKLQSNYGLMQDGIVGDHTRALINRLSGRGKIEISRSRADKSDYLIPWFGGVDNMFKVGMTANVYDVESGLSFNIKRTYGTSHADCETLTTRDTNIMHKAYGWNWSWSRRAIIVTVGGRKIAASMNGVPHCGLDKYAANVYLSWRTGGFGAGTNLDAVKGNSMDGHFCVHFLNSKTHGSDRVDEAHQNMVRKAAEWAARNNY